MNGLSHKVSFILQLNAYSALIVMCSCSFTLAQNFTVSGVIIDETTKETLPYATIRVQGATIGTVSNIFGEFDFHVPTSLLNNRLLISMLGYETYSLSLLEVRAQGLQQFELKPASRILNEVVVEDSLSGEEIFKLALARIETNYPMKPVLMDGFYRDIKKVGDRYVSLLEAAISIYDKNYKAPRDYTKLRERVGIVEIRKSFDYADSLTPYFEQYNLLEDLLLENNIKYRSFNDEPAFYDNMKRENIIGYDGAPMYLVSLESVGYDLKLYIDKESFAIFRMEFGYGDGNVPIFTYKKSRDLENRVMRLDKVVEFEPVDGVFYLKYISSNYKNEWYNTDTQNFEQTTELYQELLVNDIETDNPEWIKSSEKMKRYGLRFQSVPYNEEFWDNYNVIKETPLDRQIVKDLEQEASLEQQFKNN